MGYLLNINQPLTKVVLAEDETRGICNKVLLPDESYVSLYRAATDEEIAEVLTRKESENDEMNNGN